MDLSLRRSIYTLGNNVALSNEEIIAMIKHCLKHTPAAFNAPTTNVVVAFGEKHQQIWQIVTDVLKEKMTKKPEAFELAKAKIEGFANGVGTILYYEDTSIVDELKETYAMYADNFDTWSKQANGMLQHSIWSMLAENKIGANLQHYNPLIDDKIKELFSIPDNWTLTAQMPFGTIKKEAKEKYFEPVENRLIVF